MLHHEKKNRNYIQTNKLEGYLNSYERNNNKIARNNMRNRRLRANYHGNSHVQYKTCNQHRLMQHSPRLLKQCKLSF